jgi:Cu+-exporting ATPase
MSERGREIDKLNIAKMSKIEIPIVGMTCASCVLKVQNNLQKLPGVKNAIVNLVTEKAMIEIAPDTELNLKDVIKSVRAIGYDVAIQKISIPVEGLASASASIVESSISKLNGIVNVNINPATENITVEFVPTIISVENIKSEIEKFGFKVPHLAEEDVELYEEIIKKREYEDLKKRFIFSSILTSLILLDMLSHFFPSFW